MSLRWQLTLAFLVTCTAVLGGLGIISYRHDATALRIELARAVDGTVMRLERSLMDPLWSYDLELVEQLLEAELATNRHLARLGLELGPDQHLAFARDAGWQPVPDHSPPAQPPGRQWQLFHSGQPMGTLHLTTSERWIDAALAERAGETLLEIAVLDAALVALVAILLQRMLLNRLSGIARAIELAPDVEIAGRSGDEVAVLVSGAHALLDRLTAILDAIQDAVIVTDGRLRILRTNPAAAELLGLPQAQLNGAALADVLPLSVDGRDITEVLRQTVLDQGAILRVPGALPLRRSDGLIRQLALVASPAAGSASAAGAIIAMHDLSHLVRVEEQLRQGRKLESIGQLAGGVAHDFNNMLGAITGAAELVKLNAGDPAPCGEYADMILRVASQAADLNAKLLAFSRKGPVQRSRLAVAELVEQACTMLRHGLDRRIEIAIEPPAAPLWVEGDAAALVNCLLNLGINARDAMPDGGIFRIAWRAVESKVASDVDGTTALPPGSYVRIDVSDEGCGIPQHLIASIFDPFFTTKPQGRGTGLGLSATYGTIRAHDGQITVVSREGHGTTFTIHLPLTDGGATTSDSEAHPIAARYSGRILIIDDDDEVRRVTCALLQAQGFEAIGAACGEEGLRRFAAEPQAYTAILLDLIMPDLSGKETFDRLRAIRPDVPVILISGYNASIDIDQLLGAGARGLLTKPFRSRELLRLLAPLCKP